MVSHYWIDGIQVVGLIVGLYGLFFLSISVLGKESAPYLAALLSATAGALAGGVLLAPFQVARPLYLAYVVGYSGFGYGVGLIASPYARAGTRALEIGGWVILLALLTMVGVMLGAQVTGTYHYPSFKGLTLVAFIGGSLLYLVLSIGGMLYFGSASVTRLQRLGLALSAVALLTQFIPPVLGMFGIKVV